MTRDFTQAEKEKLQGYVQQDQDKNTGRGEFWGSAIDCVADVVNYGGLDISDYVNDLDTYHKKLIDKEDYSSTDIETLFLKVAEVDISYQELFSSSCTLLEAVNTTLAELKSLINVNSYSPESTKIFLNTDDFYEEISDVGTEVVSYYYQQYITIDEYGKEEINWNAVKEFFQRDVNDVNAMEYVAMLQLTDSFIIVGEDGELTLDMEKMEKFMESAYIYSIMDVPYTGDPVTTKNASLSPVFINFYCCMQYRNNELLCDYGYTLFDESSDEIEQLLEVDSLKTALFNACVVNYSTLGTSNMYGFSQEDVKKWEVDITIAPVKNQAGTTTHYTITAKDDMVDYRGNGEITVYGHSDTLEFIEHDSLTSTASSLYVDIDDKVKDDILKKAISVSVDTVVEGMITGNPVAKPLYMIGGFFVEEAAAVAQAEAQNNTVDCIIDINTLSYYGGALSVGGNVNCDNGRWQIVSLVCNGSELQQKVDWYNSTKKDPSLPDLTVEQLLNDYNTVIKGGEPTSELEDFAFEVSTNTEWKPNENES